MQITVTKILYWYDEPLLVEARDAEARPYMCLNCKDTEEGTWWLVAQMDEQHYQDLLECKRDLRSIFVQPDAELFYANLGGGEGETFEALPYLGYPTEDLLPDEGFYIQP